MHGFTLLHSFLLLCLLASPALANLATAAPASSSYAALAHDPDAHIKALTELIAKEPDNARLYLKRGQLLQHNQRWRLALKDFDQALKLNPDLYEVELARARLHLQVQQGRPALEAVEKFLQRDAESLPGMQVQARALKQLGRLPESCAVLRLALDAMAKPAPADYLELAKAQMALKPPAVTAALTTLDRGIQKLGCLVSLQDLAIDLELQRQEVDAALTRLQRMQQHVQRLEPWLLRQAEIQLADGRIQDAQQSCLQAQSAIQTLPPRHQRSSHTRKVADKLQGILDQCGTNKAIGLAASGPFSDSAVKLSVPAPLMESVPAAIGSSANLSPENSMQTPTGERLVVVSGSNWRFLDDGSNQGVNWCATTYDDSSWRQGSGQLGYGDGDEITAVSFGSDPAFKHITTYFRYTFDLSDAASLTQAKLRVLRDDGIVVYLNGKEVMRDNMPAGQILYGTLASDFTGGAQETTYTDYFVDPRDLVEGENLLAAEIHQVSPGNPDISFDLELVVSSDPVTVVRGLYLQCAHPFGVTLRWRTTGIADSLIYYGTDPGNLSSQLAVPGQRRDHEVVVPNLIPETRFYYAISDGNVILTPIDLQHSFVTPPLAGSAKPIRVWALGDSGTANADAAAVRDAYRTFAQGQDTDLVLMLGDNAYLTGTDSEYQAAVFDMYQATLQQSVLWPTLGNHDNAWATSHQGTYFDAFSLPTQAECGGLASGTEAYYAFDHGNVHFICLDSMSSDRGDLGSMATWLRADLANAQADWIIAFWHHPPYTDGTRDSDNPLDSEGRMTDMRQIFLPILESGGVDLVLTGHSHVYERSYLLDGHYGLSSTLDSSMILDLGDGREDGDGAYSKKTVGPAANEGAVYVVAGCSGKIDNVDVPKLEHPAMIFAVNSLGSVVLDIEGQRLQATFLDSTGGTPDIFTMLKGEDPMLKRDLPAISLQTGGTQNLTLNAGVEHAGRLYSVAGALSTNPGFYMGNAHIPLNSDIYLQLTSTPFPDPRYYSTMRGTLDAEGRAQAAIHVPILDIPDFIALDLFHAYLVYDGFDNYHAGSNPVRLRVNP